MALGDARRKTVQNRAISRRGQGVGKNEEKGGKSFLDMAERIPMFCHRIKSIPATQPNELHLHEKQS